VCKINWWGFMFCYFGVIPWWRRLRTKTCSNLQRDMIIQIFKGNFCAFYWFSFVNFLLYSNQLTSWNRFFIEKLTGPRLVKTSPHIGEPKVSLPCSWQPTALPILNQRNPVQVFLPDFFYFHVNIIPHLRLGLTSGLFLPATRFSSLSWLPQFLSLKVYRSPNVGIVTKSTGWYELDRRYGRSENCVSTLVG
jgi:hypothetical protein